MGIDIYLRWRGQTEVERNSQFTCGYSVTSGHTGYLREAYHGAPYATKYLITEDWNEQPDDGDDVLGFAIPAATLRERLPLTVFMALAREAIVYAEGDPGRMNTMDYFGEIMRKVRAIMQERHSPTELVELAAGQHTELCRRIAQRDLPDYALSYVDFVELAERKERELGEPCRVIVSA